MMNDEEKPKKKRGVGLGGTPPPKGTGNPFGRPSISPELVEMRKLNQKETVKLFNKVIWMTREELSIRAGDPKCPMIELMLLKLATEVLRTGDPNKISLILDRLIGKVKDRVEVTEMPKPTVMKLIGEDAAIVMGPPIKDDDE